MCGKIGVNYGLSLDDIIKLNSLDGQIKTYGIYGYELTKIMTDIGWPSVIDATERSLQLRIDGNNALSLKLGWLSLIIVVLSLFV